MYIYGKNVAKEKLNTNERIIKVLLCNGFNDVDILNRLKQKKIRVEYLDNKILDKKVDGLHQGIILEVDDIKTYEIKEIIPNIKSEYPLLVMLDHLEDPHNFGAIIRSSEALGVDAIIIPNDRNVSITGTVIKTSVGAISNIPIIRVTNLVNTINYLKDNNYWIVGTDMNGQLYTSIDYKMPTCLIIGNEGKGISRLVSENCDYMASIPMSGKTNSLNASVSCGIILANIQENRRK